MGLQGRAHQGVHDNRPRTRGRRQRDPLEQDRAFHIVRRRRRDYQGLGSTTDKEVFWKTLVK